MTPVFFLSLTGCNVVNETPTQGETTKANVIIREFGQSPYTSFKDDNCTFIVSAVSIGTGTNRTLINHVQAFLKTSNDVDTLIIQPYGREGEVSHCVIAKIGSDKMGLKDQVKAKLAEKGGYMRFE